MLPLPRNPKAFETAEPVNTVPKIDRIAVKRILKSEHPLLVLPKFPLSEFAGYDIMNFKHTIQAIYATQLRTFPCKHLGLNSRVSPNGRALETARLVRAFQQLFRAKGLKRAEKGKKAHLLENKKNEAFFV